MWFVTVFEDMSIQSHSFLSGDEDWPHFGDQRTWGYYDERQHAVDALHENRTDMYEGRYNYALIEKFGPGITPWCEERQWFKFDKTRNGYFEIEEPEFVKQVVNFAIG